jgi:hypothetical protein
LRWYMHPAAAGHSIALMRGAIRRHESMHSKPASQPFDRVRPLPHRTVPTASGGKGRVGAVSDEGR